MSAVSFGVSLGSFGVGLAPAATLLDWGAAAERLGYDTIWYRDHVLWHSAVLDPFSMLGALAARTSRARLGTGVLLLPLRHPVLVAKATATLDYLSGGRAILGVGVGGEFAPEFQACGVPLDERGRRADEGIEAIRALWTESPASYKGRFVQLDGVVMEPRPVQMPHPPLWVGGRSEAALRRAARHADGWMAYFATPDRLRESAEMIAGYRAKCADRPAPCRTGIILYVCVAPTREEAVRHAEHFLTTEYRQPFGHLVERYCALGTPDDCAAAIQALVDAGAGHVAVIPTRPPEHVLDQLATIASDVMPRVHPRPGAAPGE